MLNILLASTSTTYGSSYLSYLEPALHDLFAGIKQLIFVPYARPGGITHDEYTASAASFFDRLGIEVTGLHSAEKPLTTIQNAQGFFTGGGNTFLLVKQLHELGLMDPLATAVQGGARYLGTSAGSNIAGINMRTTNDMPIVYPPSFKTMGLVPFNLNPHYIDSPAGATHMGETRETRIAEFHTQNAAPVVGLREGSWIRVQGQHSQLGGDLSARIFAAGKAPYELAAGSKIVFKSGL